MLEWVVWRSNKVRKWSALFKADCCNEGASIRVGSLRLNKLAHPSSQTRSRLPSPNPNWQDRPYSPDIHRIPALSISAKVGIIPCPQSLHENELLTTLTGSDHFAWGAPVVGSNRIDWFRSYANRYHNTGDVRGGHVKRRSLFGSDLGTPSFSLLPNEESPKSQPKRMLHAHC